MNYYEKFYQSALDDAKRKDDKEDDSHDDLTKKTVEVAVSRPLDIHAMPTNTEEGFVVFQTHYRPGTT